MYYLNPYDRGLIPTQPMSESVARALGQIDLMRTKENAIERRFWGGVGMFIFGSITIISICGITPSIGEGWVEQTMGWIPLGTLTLLMFFWSMGKHLQGKAYLKRNK